MRSFLAISLLIAVPAVGATRNYVEIFNTASSSIVSFESAAAGSERFQPIALAGAPLQGGGASATVALDGSDGCLRDLRIVFANGRVLLQRDFDVCRSATYHVGRYLRPSLPRASALAASYPW